jgi:hypothetical protein
MCTSWRTVGRPGIQGRSWDRRRREFDARFGPGGWRIRHLVNGAILELAQAARLCEEAYVAFFTRHPDLLEWLCATAKDVYATAASNVRSGLDYTLQERKVEHVQDIAIRNALVRLGRQFAGEHLLGIGGRSPNGRRLNAGFVPFHRPEWVAQPPLLHWWQPDSIECFWQSNKVLQIKHGA